MTTIIVRYTTRADAAAQNQQLVENVYAELAENRPTGLRYATFRLADGVTFLHIAIRDDDADPLTRSPAFAEFQRGIGDRCTQPPQPSEATLVGSYRLVPEEAPPA